MAFNSDNQWNPTPEEREAARVAAQEERERIIQQAINDGASVQYITYSHAERQCGQRPCPAGNRGCPSLCG